MKMFWFWNYLLTINYLITMKKFCNRNVRDVPYSKCNRCHRTSSYGSNSYSLNCRCLVRNYCYRNKRWDYYHNYSIVYWLLNLCRLGNFIPWYFLAYCYKNFKLVNNEKKYINFILSAYVHPCFCSKYRM